MLFGKKQRRITRILIVEDEPLIAFDNEHFLVGEGYEIVGTLDSVAAALDLIATTDDIHLVLVDVDLSDGSGVDVARAAHARGVKVMFCTGNCPGEARAFAAGCLSKPYPQRDLLNAIAAVERILDGKPPPKRLPASFNLFVEPAV